MADSQSILELLFSHRPGGCSLTVLLFLLMLVGTCSVLLSACLCAVHYTYRASHRHETINNTTFLSVGTLSFLADGSITLVL